VNFDFSQEQQAARNEVRRLLAAHAGLKSARRALNGEERFDRALWADLGRDGWLGAAVPEALGGTALGYETQCCIAEEVGRSMAAIPFATSAVLVTDALVRCGSDAQRRQFVPALVRGERIGAMALVQGNGPLPAAARGTEFVSGRLTGRKIAVSDGMSADFFLVLGESGGAPGLYLVEASALGVQRESQQGIDPTHQPAKLCFEGASATPLPGVIGWKSIEALLDRAAVILAFEQLGSADAALEMATMYAKSRHAFGRPIGSFQAVKHKLADVYIGNELARSNAYYAAWALQSEAPSLALAAAAARVSATEALERAARESIQVHGGMAVTWEHDAHLFYRRAQQLALMLGGLREWQYRLVAELARSA
jgi:alkylation response protein AidB-like acyl-CoA dehydrogenase